MQMKKPLFVPALCASAFMLTGLAACSQQPQATPAVPASTTTMPATSAGAGKLRLERVVMLMRHGVRSPTKAQVSPPGTNDQPWPQWSVDPGMLTRHGADAARLLGGWDRTNWMARGLFSGNGCPAAGDVTVAASSTPRTQVTAHAWIEGFAPACQIIASFPASKKDDVEFHPFDAGSMSIDPGKALQAEQAMAPPGGLAADVSDHASLFALLNHAMGCEPKSACDISQMSSALVRSDDGPAKVGKAFGIPSTISESIMLEYTEGMPMKDVAWGRLDQKQIETLLQFHPIKFHYEARAPYVAAIAASPLASRMLKAVGSGPKLTMLVGHDTNIADLAGMLDLHWQVPSFPRDDPPPGGAIGFEVLADASGKQFVHAFYRSQTMDQIRNLDKLDAKNPASYSYLTIPGCAEICPMADFERIVSAKLVKPEAAPAAH
ncbi:MAG TPA: histidine-type phosphatase [Rhodanobacter sp.]|nr:histidine-type phosphatase [Rhodanobacter sp.]